SQQPGDLSNDLAFGQGGALLASAGDIGVYLWDPLTGERPHRVELWREDMAKRIAFSPDGWTLAVAATTADWKPKGKIGLLDVETLRMRALPDIPEVATSLAFLPDGKTLVYRTDTGMRFVDVASGMEIRRLALRGSAGRSAPSPAVSRGGLLIAGAGGFDDGLDLGPIRLLSVADLIR